MLTERQEAGEVEAVKVPGEGTVKVIVSPVAYVNEEDELMPATNLS